MLSCGTSGEGLHDVLCHIGIAAGRILDPEDRRGILVELTEQGHQLIDRAVVSHVANEARLLQSLSQEDQQTLATLLRTWLSSLEDQSTMQP